MATTKRPMVREHNTEIDEVIDREMNDFEFADWQARQAEIAAIESARQATLDKLAALGLTPEDLAVLN